LAALGGTVIATFRWNSNGPPPAASSHSVAKLDLIRLYLRRYFQTIAVRHGIDRQRITLVDGFCGGGAYMSDGSLLSGTPLLLLEVVEEARHTLNVGRTKPIAIDAQFHFIDSSKAAIEALRGQLASAGHLNLLGTDIHLKRSTFVEAYPAIKESIRARTHRSVGRSVFVLDQKGYTDVPLATIRDIFTSFTGAEVILTFAVGWLIDYLTDRPETVKSLGPLELSAGQVREYVQLRDQRGGRIAIQRLLLRHLKEETGATFVSPFFLRSAEANKDLWVVHLSRHVTARNVMVQSHWDTKNHSWHPGQGGLEILGFDPTLDPSATPDFWFGEAEERVMLDTLAEDVVRRIRDQHSHAPVPYLEFVAGVANETAARMADFDSVASLLIERREIRVLNDQGSVRRASRPSRHDKIEIHPQPSFHLVMKART
jgi:three-Cys-motif partner protein